MKEWMAAYPPDLDLLIIQIDGIHINKDVMLLAAVRPPTASNPDLEQQDKAA